MNYLFYLMILLVGVGFGAAGVILVSAGRIPVAWKEGYAVGYLDGRNGLIKELKEKYDTLPEDFPQESE